MGLRALPTACVGVRMLPTACVGGMHVTDRIFGGTHVTDRSYGGYECYRRHVTDSRVCTPVVYSVDKMVDVS